MPNIDCPVKKSSLMACQSKTRAYQKGLCSPRFNGISMNINSKKLVNWNLFCQLMMIHGVNFLYNKMVSMENSILSNIGTVSLFLFYQISDVQETYVRFSAVDLLTCNMSHVHQVKKRFKTKF